MTDSRQQFEAWAAKEHPQLYLQYLPRVGCYSNSDAELAWQCWQASRADCVVELPHTVYRGDYRQDGTSNLDWEEYYETDEIKAVLDKVGVPYK